MLTSLIRPQIHLQRTDLTFQSHLATVATAWTLDHEGSRVSCQVLCMVLEHLEGPGNAYWQHSWWQAQLSPGHEDIHGLLRNAGSKLQGLSAQDGGNNFLWASLAIHRA